ncbi:HrpJ domain-containing protein [Aureimonas leprariae]|uniref:Hypersensitivity response secretion-like HrpJ domain-containing protein n=1 Tax=Plantimonas leprariae TaxID=2615207 RepID=A0A7V7TV33_9HYPH|nr:HrpJ domain-containing protein [Aureimonas leprariae]KAB0676836.1 hypothetical protein F6X38_19895 [Aureimonas leprariae]
MSSIETLRQNVAALNVTSPVGTEVMREARGSYRGETVQVSSEDSKLEEAKEEIGMAVAHRADRKTLGQRQVRQGQGANLDAISRIADYYDKLPNMPREAALAGLVDDLQAMLEQLMAGGGGGEGGPTPEDVLRALQRFDGDPTHQFAALEIARDFFAAQGASDEFMALLDAAYGEFQRGDLGRDVRAGFASAEAAARASATLETDPATVRDTYRQLLKEQKDMGALFDAFRRFDVLKSMDEIVATFMEAAGRDLASTGPSTDPVFLHNLVTELSKLKKMQSAIDMAGDLVRLTDRQMQPGEKATGSNVDVAGQLLGFAAREAASLPDARSLLQRYAACSVATQLAFANGLRGLHLELPDGVMASIQARLLQNEALVALLDALVEEEEEEYEDEERRRVERDGGEGEARR